jgi:tetratricopeptide (TPR) repeat protein
VPLTRPVTEKKKNEQKGVGAPLLVIFLIVVASLGSGYVSYAGLAASLRGEVNASPLEVPEWQGNLGDEQGIAVTSMAVSAGEGLGSAIPGKAGREAMRYLRKDTEKGYENALARIDKALEKETDSPDLPALYIHALVFAESLGRDGEINLSAGRARSELDGFSASLLNKDAMVRARAHVLLGERRFEEARQLLRGHLSRNAYDPLALSLMGESYLYRDDPDPREAIEYLESAVRLDQGPVRAHWDLALAYRMTGQYQKAEEVYELIKEKSPERAGVGPALQEVRRKIEENESPVLDIAPDKKETVAPIKKTGPRISINVLEVISEVGPQIKKFNPEAARQRQVPTYPQPNYAPPPEAAPR